MTYPSFNKYEADVSGPVSGTGAQKWTGHSLCLHQAYTAVGDGEQLTGDDTSVTHVPSEG